MIIGIGGISNTGKSKLALRIKDYYSARKVRILCQDDYAFPKNSIPLIRNHVDWERPESIDFNYFERVVTEEIGKNDIMIIEGIFAFNKDNLNKLIEKKIFLTLESKSFLSRKCNDFRWGKEPDWYIEHIWNNHEKYCKQNVPKEALTIAADKNIDLKEVINFIEVSIVK